TEGLSNSKNVFQTVKNKTIKLHRILDKTNRGIKILGILHEIFDHIDNNYITNEVHEYLTTFFNEDHSARGWDDAINNAIISDKDSVMITNTKKLIKETLPKL
ncbi:22412_t:CDS:2, partial [Gigaspora margarita]